MHVHSRVESPSGVATVEIDNGSEVIEQRDVHVQATGDETTSLEEIVIVLLPCFLCHFFGELVGWLGESAIFVDDRQLLDNIVVESIEHDQKYTTSGWEAKHAFFGETIWLQFTLLECSDLILVGLNISVQS